MARHPKVKNRRTASIAIEDDAMIGFPLNSKNPWLKRKSTLASWVGCCFMYFGFDSFGLKVLTMAAWFTNLATKSKIKKKRATTSRASRMVSLLFFSLKTALLLIVVGLTSKSASEALYFMICSWLCEWAAIEEIRIIQYTACNIM